MDTGNSWQRRSGNLLDALSHQPKSVSSDPRIPIEPAVPPAQALDQPPVVMSLAERFTKYEALGAGGFATVYRAQDNVLGRIVALKLPHLPLSVLPETSRRRFVTELHASGALHHPNIVPVFDAGVDQDQCFLVSEYVAGRTLAKWQADQPEPISFDTAAEIVRQLAEAVQHAHDANVLHRDLKPSNILVDENRPSGALPFTPRITDFGLARMCEADVTATQDGHVLGSPPYMSPEQAQGKNSKLGPPTDVYALGVTLYQLVTRQLPTTGPTSAAVLHSVIHDEPWPPRRHRSDLPGDLNAICLKCLEKEIARRYSSAHELAVDLRHFLEGQPVSVRSPNSVERTWRWAKRYPAWASLMATVIVCAAAVVSLLVKHSGTVADFNTELSDANERLATTNNSLKVALRQSQEAAERAAQEERHALEAVYVSDIRRGFEAWQKWDALELNAVVSRYADDTAGGSAPNNESRQSLRGPEWHWLRRQFQRESREITRLPRAVYRMTLNSAGTKLVVTGRDDLIRVVEWPAGRTLSEWSAGQREVNGLAFSADGQTLWTGGDDGTVKAWNFTTQTETLRFDAHPGKFVYELVHDPARNLLITCANEPTIRLWDAGSGESRGTLTGHSNSIDVIVLHPDGRRLFSGSTDQTIRVWDLESRTGQVLTDKTSEKIYGLAISNDGRWLASGAAYGQFLLWDLERNVARMNIQMKDAVDRVRFDPTNRRVFVLDAIGVTTEWVVPADDLREELPKTPAKMWQNEGVKPYDVLMSPDGREIVSAGRDGRVVAFALAPPATDEFSLRLSRVMDFVWLSENQLAVADDRHLVVIDDFKSRTEPRVFDDSPNWHSIEVSADRSLLAAKSRNGEFGIWRLADGQRIMKRMAKDGDEHKEFSLSTDGRLLAIANSNSDRVELVDVQTGEMVQQFDARSCFHAMFSVSGDLFAYDGFESKESDRRDLRLLDWPSGRQRAIVPSRSIYGGTQSISPDGRWIAIAAERTVQLRNTHTGELVHELFGHRADIRHVTFSPDSSRLATAGTDECVKLWHVATGQYLLEFPLNSRSSASRCQFSPDGCWLAYLLKANTLHFMRLQ